MLEEQVEGASWWTGKKPLPKPKAGTDGAVKGKKAIGTGPAAQEVKPRGRGTKAASGPAIPAEAPSAPASEAGRPFSAPRDPRGLPLWRDLEIWDSVGTGHQGPL